MGEGGGHRKNSHGEITVLGREKSHKKQISQNWFVFLFSTLCKKWTGYLVRLGSVSSYNAVPLLLFLYSLYSDLY